MEYKEGMTFEDFVGQKKRRRKNKRQIDYSTKDYLEHYKHSVWRYQGGLTKAGKRRKRMAKNSKWKLTPAMFRKIVVSINSLLLEATLQGQDIELPIEFGILYARQKPVYTKIDENGNLKTNRAINWRDTLKLWYEDKESREAKQLVYQEDCKAKPYVKIQFGDFTNKRFLEFHATHKNLRDITRAMSQEGLVLPNRGTSVKAIKDNSYDRERTIY